jgi:hypothetical protein
MNLALSLCCRCVFLFFLETWEGGREDVRVDVHIERGVVKLVSPSFFLCLVRDCP